MCFLYMRVGYASCNNMAASCKYYLQKYFLHISISQRIKGFIFAKSASQSVGQVLVKIKLKVIMVMCMIVEN